MESNVALDGLPQAQPGPIDVELHVMRADSCPAVGAPWLMVDPPRTAWRAPGALGSRLRLQFHGTRGEWVEFVVEDDGERAGKSTLALALVQRGARLLSDDVAVLTEREGVIAVAVGRAQLRIREDSAEALSGSYAKLRPVWVNEDARPRKRYYDVAEGQAEVSSTPVALGGVFLLAPRGDENPYVRALSAGELLPRLIANRHMASLQDREGHRRDFARLASIAGWVPAAELRRPDSLSTALTAADAVLDDIARS
jgi:hypothetical protein